MSAERESGYSFFSEGKFIGELEKQQRTVLRATRTIEQIMYTPGIEPDGEERRKLEVQLLSFRLMLEKWGITDDLIPPGDLFQQTYRQAVRLLLHYDALRALRMAGGWLYPHLDLDGLIITYPEALVAEYGFSIESVFDRESDRVSPTLQRIFREINRKVAFAYLVLGSWKEILKVHPYIIQEGINNSSYAFATSVLATRLFVSDKDIEDVRLITLEPKREDL